MLAIRLQRVGRKNDPSFRIIVTDSKLKPKTGNFLEILGSYDARKGKPIVDIARAKHWLSMGAQASGTVHNILVDLKAVSAKKINVLGKKTPIVKEAPKTEEKKAEASKVEEKAEVKIETPDSEIPAEKEAVAEVKEA